VALPKPRCSAGDRRVDNFRGLEGKMGMKSFGKSMFARFMSLMLVACMTVTLGTSANARYISPDSFDPTQPAVGTNRYAYAGNDPINNSDPNGHLFGWDDGIAAGIGAIGGLIGQAGADIYHGQLSDASEYGISATAGAVSAWAGYNSSYGTTPAGGAAIGGATYSAVSDALHGKVPSVKDAAVGAVLGVATLGVVKGGAAALKAGVVSKTATSFTRDLTAADLGVKGNLTQLKGSITVKYGAATVTVDMIEGKISNPLGIVKNLSDLAKASGATSLTVQGTIANPSLYRALEGRYGLKTDGSVDSFTVNIGE